MRINCRIFKTLVGALAFMGVFLFFHAGSIAPSPSNNAAPSSVTTVPTENFEQWKLLGRGNLVMHRKLDFNYVSKRRVPNGPDPIHNRRAERTRRPPNRE